jgi:hypothetical protein
METSPFILIMEEKLPLTKEQRKFIEEKNQKVLDWRKVFSQQPLAEPLKSIANGLRQARTDNEGCSGH